MIGMAMPRARIDVGILGATGTVGQQFIRILKGNPWFRPACGPRASGPRDGATPRRRPGDCPTSCRRRSARSSFSLCAPQGRRG